MPTQFRRRRTKPEQDILIPQKVRLAKLLLPLPLGGYYSYLVPETMQVVVGEIVGVNFANRNILGCVMEIAETEDGPKSVTEKTATEAEVKMEPNGSTLDLFGVEAYSSVFPTMSKPNGSTLDLFGAETPSNVSQSELKSKSQFKPILFSTHYIFSAELLQFLQWTASYNVSHTGMVFKMSLPNLGRLRQQRLEKIFRPMEGMDIAQLKLTPKQQQILQYLTEVGESNFTQLHQQVPVGIGVLNGLVQKGWVQESQRVKVSWDTYRPERVALLQLSPAQEEIFQQLIRSNTFRVHLIHGVTGSGKTEVYFHFLQHLLKQYEAERGQVLLLLPEIVLTSQLVQRFQQQFNYLPVVWHSGVESGKKSQYYHGVYSGDVRVVIGTRSALFLPYHNLRAIILDEEHEQSLKQEDGGVFYQARDMAIVRARSENIPVLLLSATPSLESLANVESGKYQKYVLPARFGQASMPNISLIDLTQDKPEKGRIISPSLGQAMLASLTAHQQVMLYLNRRGYAPLVLCGHCGERVTCPNCNLALTEHRSIHKLLCHHCGHGQTWPKVCQTCGATDDFRSCGVGVERVAEEVERLFPQARVALMTSDAIKTMVEAEQLMQQILHQEVDIIIGTQMIAKGHHFPALSLVGVLDTDAGFYGGDFRAMEKIYQILSQVSGRAGRAETQGRVLIQSYNPKNVVLQALVTGNETAFIQLEMQNRRLFNMPPYGKMIAFIVSSPAEEFARVAAVELSNRLLKILPEWGRDGHTVEVFAPVPAALARIQNRYRYRLLLHFKQPKYYGYLPAIKQRLLQLVEYLQTKYKQAIRIKVDVDPYNFL